MENYSVLATYYDRFSQDDCDYPRWAQFLCNVARKANVRTIADVACGTGKMTQLLASNGFAVVGVDSSAQMLQHAQAKCRATFVLQDMKKLALPKPVDMVVVVNDGVNYISPKQLQPFFANVAKNLRSGGVFAFDISSPHKLQNVLGNNVFFVDCDDATLLWTNKTTPTKTEMFLTLFEKEGQLYRRSDEHHTQHIHMSEDICNALATSGFCDIQVSADYGKALTQKALRITFVATKA